MFCKIKLSVSLLVLDLVMTRHHQSKIYTMVMLTMVLIDYGQPDDGTTD